MCSSWGWVPEVRLYALGLIRILPLALRAMGGLEFAVRRRHPSGSTLRGALG